MSIYKDYSDYQKLIKEYNNIQNREIELQEKMIEQGDVSIVIPEYLNNLQKYVDVLWRIYMQYAQNRNDVLRDFIQQINQIGKMSAEVIRLLQTSGKEDVNDSLNFNEEYEFRGKFKPSDEDITVYFISGSNIVKAEADFSEEQGYLFVLNEPSIINKISSKFKNDENLVVRIKGYDYKVLKSEVIKNPVKYSGRFILDVKNRKKAAKSDLII